MESPEIRRKGGRVVAFLLGLAMSGAGLAASAPPVVNPDRLEAAREISGKLEQSGLLLGDQEIDGRLQSVADRLWSISVPQTLPPVRIRALKGAAPNAFALPNGDLYITTELLVRLDNEAQLATVLGHEIAHYTEAHAERQARSESRRSALSMTFALLLGGLAASALGSSAIASSIATGAAEAGNVWVQASISGYSREHELEADRLGLERMRSAGYDPFEAIRVFDVLTAATPDGERSDNPKFASHPRLSERRASYSTLLETAQPPSAGPGNAGVATAEWQQQLGRLPLRQIEIKLEQRDYAGGLALAKSLAPRWPEEARLDFLVGELHRLGRAAPDFDAQAMTAYARATSKPGTPPDAWRQLGYLHRRAGSPEQAAAAFRRFLELRPDAVEAPLLRGYLDASAPTIVPDGGSR